MTFYAIAVFVVAYAFIISERFNKTTVALIGAGLMVCLPVIDSPDVSYSQDSDDADRQPPDPHDGRPLPTTTCCGGRWLWVATWAAI